MLFVLLYSAMLNKKSHQKNLGFYRIWGVLVFLPALYVTPVTLIAQQKQTIMLPLMVFFFILSLTSIFINADIDRQRFQFRQSNGMIKIWGKDPFFINAKYRRENGETSINLLLGKFFIAWLFFLSALLSFLI